MPQRLKEYFTDPENTRPFQTVSSVPAVLYPQERDWTCAVACIRTCLSSLTQNVPSENEIITRYHLSKGPHFVEEIIEKNIFSAATEVKTHRDYDKADLNLHTLVDLLSANYFIMTESMISYDHWLVVLGYFAVGDLMNPEAHKILLYDPYYDRVRLDVADEFECMWCSQEGRYREFIAVR